MKKFIVSIIDSSGRQLERTLYAVSEQEARRIAARQSLYILEFKAKSSVFTLLQKQERLSSSKLAVLFQQLSVMTATGITFVQGWRLIQRDMPKKHAAKMEMAAQLMETGMNPSAAMEKSGLFPVLACDIVKAGENSGNLDKMLSLLGEYYEKAGKQKQGLINILVYPVFLISCTVLMLFCAMFYIFPVFEMMFRQMNVPLPVPAQIMLSLQHQLRDYPERSFLTVIVFVVGSIVGVRQQRYRVILEEYMMQIGILRRICIVGCWARFSRILAIQLAGGMPLLSALYDAAAVIPVIWFKKKISSIIRYLESGMSFSRAVQNSKSGTAYIETMLLVGESTGNYEEVLQTISGYYEWRLNIILKRGKKLLEPTILLITGIVVGGIILCLLLPLLDAVTFMVK